MRTSAQTGGARADLDLELSPTAHLPPEHIHLRQEERFEVLSGQILLKCRGEELKYRGEESVRGPGEIVAVAPGSPSTPTACRRLSSWRGWDWHTTRTSPGRPCPCSAPRFAC